MNLILQAIKSLFRKLENKIDKDIVSNRSDWEQNNENGAGYIKNRPFYSKEEKIDVLPISDYQTDDYDDMMFYICEGQLIEGISYIVTFNDITETRLAVIDSDGKVALEVSDNTDLTVRNYNSSEIEFFSWDTDAYSICRLGLSYIKGEIKQIDEKYLPDSIVDSLQTKMDKDNPTGTGSFSMNRLDSSEIGDYSHAEGYKTEASGDYSHAEGRITTASGISSHAEGYINSNLYHIIASGAGSHAEGCPSAAKVTYGDTIASGDGSHAEGAITVANGLASHAEGAKTVANGNYSHAEGWFTTASGFGSHVQGKKNIIDEECIYAHIVGNGDGHYSSNAHTLDWEGNAWYAGDVYVGSTSGTNKDEGSKKLATEEYADTPHASSLLYLTDQSSGFQYSISMNNGSLVSSPRPFTYVVTTPPSKTTYVVGEYFDATGMQTAVIYDDGPSKEITDYTFNTSYLPGSNITGITIKANIFDTEYNTVTPIKVSALDPATYLADYTYTDNGDGTYTVTGWADTTKTDELTIPNNYFVEIGG